jgi:hypothetical protein
MHGRFRYPQSGMLTRGEIEGQLRELHPLRERVRAQRRASFVVRRYARIAVAVVLGVVMVAVLGSTGARSAPASQGAMRQLAAWGIERVRSVRADDTPFFPARKHDRGNAYSSRARAARDAVRDAQRIGKR